MVDFPCDTTRKSPARLAFRQQKRGKQEKSTKTTQETGPESKQKHPLNRSAVGRSGIQDVAVNRLATLFEVSFLAEPVPFQWVYGLEACSRTSRESNYRQD